MSQSKKHKAMSANDISWPSEAELAKVRAELSADDVMGSSILSPDATALEKFKYKLCELILIYRRKSGLKQKELAQLLGIDESRMSEILHYKIKKLSSDRLQEHAQRLYPNIKFDATAA